MQILTDTSAMYSPKEGKQKGIAVFPLQVMVDEKAYEDLAGINDEQLLKRIADGASVSTSQPSVGDKIAFYEEHPDEQCIDITMAKGLSGTYDSAVLASNSAPHPENITIINSKTLCGPHQYLVNLAKKMADENSPLQEIREKIQSLAETDCSYLIPFDFHFLKRGGRVSSVSASLGSILKLIPVMKKREDGTILDKLTVTRTWSKAVKSILEDMQAHGVKESYQFYISHADNLESAETAKQIILKMFPHAHITIQRLTPAFIVQGGPKCVSIQAIASAV